MVLVEAEDTAGRDWLRSGGMTGVGDLALALACSLAGARVLVVGAGTAEALDKADLLDVGEGG